MKVKEKDIDTGLSYFGVIIGDDTCVGIHASTMPGVFIGSSVIIGPGVVLHENLPDDSRLFSTKPAP